jgi:ABC-2 type transport system ATP-binding protein
VLYTTHYLPELAELDATLAFVRGGVVIVRGTQEELTGHQCTLDDLYRSLAAPVTKEDCDVLA